MPELRSLITGRPVVTLPATASALDAAREMTRQRIGAILVVGADGRPRGIFTERDLMKGVVVEGLDPAAVRLEEAMTRELYSAPPTCKVAEARQELQQRHIRHLPIVEDGRAVAMLSLRDLLRADLEQCTTDVHEMQRYIQGAELSEPDAG